jgi:hypothetical protein
MIHTARADFPQVTLSDFSPGCRWIDKALPAEYLAGLLLPLAPLALYAGSGALLAGVTLVLAVLNAATWRPVR